MRYYRIEIDDGTVFTSQVNGSNARGALQVDLDIPVASFSSPGNGGAYLKIWGIPLSMIAQSKNLNRKGIKVYGGMAKGLPLATAAARAGQAGLLVQGWIYQAYGNWVGTDMSLDLVVLAGPPPASGKTLNEPKNITLNWRKGSGFADAVKSALGPAFSGFDIAVNVNSKIAALEDQVGFYPTLSSFASWVKAMSIALVGGTNYPGVDITMSGRTISVFDDTKSSSGTSKQILFTDLIGQPTWIQAPSIAFKTMMRADLQIGQKIKMPKTLVTNSQQAQSALVNQVAAQQGEFIISTMRHIGSFRQPDAYSWVTEFNAFPTQVSGT